MSVYKIPITLPPVVGDGRLGCVRVRVCVVRVCGRVRVCVHASGEDWQMEKGNPRGRLCCRLNQLKGKKTKQKPENMSEAAHGQMVFCSTEGERTIEAMVET